MTYEEISLQIQDLKNRFNEEFSNFDFENDDPYDRLEEKGFFSGVEFIVKELVDFQKNERVSNKGTIELLRYLNTIIIPDSERLPITLCSSNSDYLNLINTISFIDVIDSKINDDSEKEKEEGNLLGFFFNMIEDYRLSYLSNDNEAEKRIMDKLRYFVREDKAP